MKKYMRSIKHWDESDRPREKLLKNGAGSLSTTELLAIILGSGTRSLTAVDLSREILKNADQDLLSLNDKSINELMQFKGIGTAKAITIKALLELIKRTKYKQKPQRKIHSSKDVYQEMYADLYNKHQEEFWLLFINNNNVLKGKKQISLGGIDMATVDLKVIFKHALLNNATGIILVHNHPSNNPNPSVEDKLITEKIKKAARLLDISLVDHLIFCDNTYFSFIDQGLLP